MADQAPQPEPGDDTGVRPGPGPTGMPLWVKVFLIIAIVLVVAFIVSRLFGVQHGPSQHGGLGGYTPPIESRMGQA
jgi:hypothetical protein